MTKEQVIEKLEFYIRQNFVDLGGLKFSVSSKYSGLTGKIKKKIDDILAKFDCTFSNYLRDLIKQKGLTEVEVYKKAHLDRRIFSKLRNVRSYKPSERTVLAIAFAMELDIEEAEELLSKCGYALSPYYKLDLIIRFFFENHIYDLFTINEILEHYGFQPLGE